jgi:hypothetical protein
VFSDWRKPVSAQGAGAMHPEAALDRRALGGVRLDGRGLVPSNPIVLWVPSQNGLRLDAHSGTTAGVRWGNPASVAHDGHPLPIGRFASNDRQSTTTSKGPLAAMRISGSMVSVVLP